jgi:two-component system, NarL family, sensor histidine kinase DevS
MDEARLRRLLDVGRSMISELEPEAVLQRLLEVARELTGARYAAIGVLDERREKLEIDLAARHVTEVESTTYRLVQEGLTNAVKHAGATRVSVRVIDRDETIEIEMRDDGRGFDPAAGVPGFGLIGMRERVALVHGTLDVESAPGAGTTLHARIPAAYPASAGREGGEPT